MFWNFKHTTRILAESEAKLDSALKDINKGLRIEDTVAWAAATTVASVSGALHAASGFMVEDRADLVQLLDACHTLTWWIDQRDHWDVADLTEEDLTEFWRLAGNARRMVGRVAASLEHTPILRDLTVPEEAETEEEDV